MRHLSIEALENDVWPDSDLSEATSLIEACYRARKIPLMQLSIWDLVRLLNERIGHPFAMWEAIHRLSENPVIEGDLYEGDLLLALVRRASEETISDELYQKIVSISKTALSDRSEFAISADVAKEIGYYLGRVKTEPNQSLQTTRLPPDEFGKST